ncbi:unnamed protein product [Prunus armeniaca]|uniref:Uncharacterized protein n=1 Tax=Prunus armeniaca TaxID=36596 RepID=A0A6J5UU03_PRUAR|nr:unnamed protein product [Prunus armeniaca]CAB4278655.1 unnamed protein product [Prunus armeniaca]CAB4309081.1 unnamed protein product [Prunus armeniaca]
MGLVSGWGAATRGGGGRNPAATTPPPWSTELLGTPSQMHRHVDNNLISQLTTTRVGWRWVDSRGLELPSQIFQTNFIKTNFSNEFHQNENKCFVAFGVVGERRVGAERVKFNLGVHGCF